MKKSIVFMCIILAFSAALVSASEWEWIVEFTYAEASGSGCGEPSYNSSFGGWELSRNCTYNAKMKVDGTSNWNEKAAFYYKNGNDWLFLKRANQDVTYGWDCKNDIILNPGNPVAWSCLFTTSGMPIQTLLNSRASINWEQCGSWTATPSASCGDTKDLTIWLN